MTRPSKLTVIQTTVGILVGLLVIITAMSALNPFVLASEYEQDQREIHQHLTLIHKKTDQILLNSSLSRKVALEERVRDGTGTTEDLLELEKLKIVISDLRAS